MKFLCLLFLGTSLVSLSSACGILETKRTCECTAVYTMGGGVEKILIPIQPRIDCLPVSSCSQVEFNNCSNYCQASVKKDLGGQESNLTPQGSDKVCELVSLNQIVTAEKRIRVLASWRYVGCTNASGVDEVVDDLCCYRKCGCLMKAEMIVGQFNVKDPINLGDRISYEQISYKCWENELEMCRIKCFRELGNFLNRKDLDQVDLRRRNLDIFTNQPYSSEQACKLANRAPRPGMDVYLEIDDQLGTKLSRRTFLLGRVCCRQDCKCEWIFTDARMGTQLGIEPVVNSMSLDTGYDCSIELNRCIENCRRRAIAVVNSFNPSYDQKQKTVQENDYLSVAPFRSMVCELAKQSSASPGVNVYVRHTNGLLASTYPNREDIHVGRLCCLKNGAFISPQNRCQN